MEILIGAIVAGVVFLVAYKMISPSKEKEIASEPVDQFVCDVCQGNVCECRPENETDS